MACICVHDESNLWTAITSSFPSSVRSFQYCVQAASTNCSTSERNRFLLIELLTNGWTHRWGSFGFWRCACSAIAQVAVRLKWASAMAQKRQYYLWWTTAPSTRCTLPHLQVRLCGLSRRATPSWSSSQNFLHDSTMTWVIEQYERVNEPLKHKDFLLDLLNWSPYSEILSVDDKIWAIPDLLADRDTT